MDTLTSDPIRVNLEAILEREIPTPLETADGEIIHVGAIGDVFVVVHIRETSSPTWLLYDSEDEWREVVERLVFQKEDGVSR